MGLVVVMNAKCLMFFASEKGSLSAVSISFLTNYPIKKVLFFPGLVLLSLLQRFCKV